MLTILVQEILFDGICNGFLWMCLNYQKYTLKYVNELLPSQQGFAFSLSETKFIWKIIFTATIQPNS